MAFDFDNETLLSTVTLTGGTLTSAHQNDNMSGFCMAAVVSNGLFTSGTYMWLEGSIEGTTGTYAVITDSTTTINAVTGSAYLWNFDAPYFNHVRVGFTVPSGNIVVNVKIRSLGDR